MKNSERVACIKQRLTEAFSPIRCEVIDDSEQHRGHAGSQSGAGHFTVIIRAACFDGLTKVAAHRQIYAVLGDLMPGEVHALRIRIEE